MESIIKWRTGTPTTSCNCIVFVKNHKGEIYTSTDNWSANFGNWNIHNYKRGFYVLCWYPISEITPLQEE